MNNTKDQLLIRVAANETNLMEKNDMQHHHQTHQNVLQRFIRSHRAYIQKERRSGLKDRNNMEINKMETN